MIFAYMRVSTPDQKFDLQLDAILQLGVEEKNIYKDISSGARKERKQFDLMLSRLRKGDKVIFWKLDRIGRDARHLANLFHNWGKVGIDFLSITEPFLETDTPHGWLIFNVMSAFAQFNRDVIVERTNHGLKAAKKRGRTGGRPKGLSDKAKNKARMVESLYKDGMTISNIMDATGIRSRQTIYRYLEHRKVKIDGSKPLPVSEHA